MHFICGGEGAQGRSFLLGVGAAFPGHALETPLYGTTFTFFFYSNANEAVQNHFYRAKCGPALITTPPVVDFSRENFENFDPTVVMVLRTVGYLGVALVRFDVNNKLDWTTSAYPPHSVSFHQSIIVVLIRLYKSISLSSCPIHMQSPE